MASILKRFTEAGKRQSATDAAMIQTMHDNSVSLGASAAESSAIDHPRQRVRRLDSSMATANLLGYRSGATNPEHLCLDPRSTTITW